LEEHNIIYNKNRIFVSKTKNLIGNRVAARISLRMEQLSNLPTNMPEDLRIQAQIELRMLRVLNFQRQLRSEVLQFMDFCCFL
jgi:hypothetical protein